LSCLDRKALGLTRSRLVASWGRLVDADALLAVTHAAVLRGPSSPDRRLRPDSFRLGANSDRPASIERSEDRPNLTGDLGFTRPEQVVEMPEALAAVRPDGVASRYLDWCVLSRGEAVGRELAPA
jgi:hypothetical protein